MIDPLTAHGVVSANGDPVLAMGNAFRVGLSVSAGIVSALNRNIEDSAVDNLIQTDAAINHGNSGGPLFNLKGEVIGVNSTIISPTPANSGLGFAIPSNDAHFAFQRMGSVPVPIVRRGLVRKSRL